MIKILVTAGIVVVALLVVLVAVAIWKFGSPKSGLSSASGSLRDLDFYASCLQDANSPRAFLLVSLEGSPDFLQMKYSDGEFELDYPLISDRQRSMENEIRGIYEELELEIVENPSTAGHTFLDVYLSSREILVATAIEVFTSAFGATSESRIEYAWSDMVAEKT